MAWEIFLDQMPQVAFYGKAEKCVYWFRGLPEQIPGDETLAEYLIQGHLRELEKQNSQLLRLTVWRDTSPTFYTDYWVEVIATASPLWWNVIILGALAAIILAVLTWSIIEVQELVWGEGDGGEPPLFQLFSWAVFGAVALGIIGLIAIRRVK